MDVPAASFRTICTYAPELGWPQLQPVGESSSTAVGSSGCSIDRLPEAGGANSNGMWRATCHSTMVLRRIQHVPVARSLLTAHLCDAAWLAVLSGRRDPELFCRSAYRAQ